MDMRAKVSDYFRMIGIFDGDSNIGSVTVSVSMCYKKFNLYKAFIYAYVSVWALITHVLFWFEPEFE